MAELLETKNDITWDLVFCFSRRVLFVLFCSLCHRVTNVSSHTGLITNRFDFFIYFNFLLFILEIQNTSKNDEPAFSSEYVLKCSQLQK